MCFFRKNKNNLLLFLSAFLYFLVAYFLERNQFNLLAFLWFTLFLCFYFLVKKSKLSFKKAFLFAVFFRGVFLFAIPNLSQDFYRFIWDGSLLLSGWNPYLYLPETLIQQKTVPFLGGTTLYQEMGGLNASHYTNYPPLNQINFLLAAFVANKGVLASVVVLRLQIILADVGIIYFGGKLLKNLQQNRKHIFWYALNPFVIIELTGNLHFESVMLFFLITSMYLLQQRKWVFASVLFACSVSIKLIPLLFLPLFYKWFMVAKNQSKYINFNQLLGFYILVIGLNVLFFFPFYSSTLITNYTQSVGLWFQNFEFNASLYYLFREIGYTFRGWNEIAIIGKIMPFLTVLFLIGITFFRKNSSFRELITALLFGLSFYYFTTTTMHPWYLATLVLLSVFTEYRFPLVWSLVIVLSYHAYSNIPWKENLYIVILEYIIVYTVLFFEIYKYRKRFS